MTTGKDFLFLLVLSCCCRFADKESSVCSCSQHEGGQGGPGDSPSHRQATVEPLETVCRLGESSSISALISIFVHSIVSSQTYKSYINQLGSQNYP